MSSGLAGAVARLRRSWDGDVLYDFRRSPPVVTAALILGAFVVSAALAPWIAPHQVFDVQTLDLSNASLPPAWLPQGMRLFFLGTDDQGRDVLSAILFG